MHVTGAGFRTGAKYLRFTATRFSFPVSLPVPEQRAKTHADKFKSLNVSSNPFTRLIVEYPASLHSTLGLRRPLEKVRPPTSNISGVPCHSISTEVHCPLLCKICFLLCRILLKHPLKISHLLFFWGDQEILKTNYDRCFSRLSRSVLVQYCSKTGYEAAAAPRILSIVGAAFLSY